MKKSNSIQIHNVSAGFFILQSIRIARKSESPLSKIIWTLASFYILIGGFYGYSEYRSYKYRTEIFVSSRAQLAGADYESWKIQSMNGVKRDFFDFKNKVVFINIWATWCGPCRSEMPSIQTLYDKCRQDDLLRNVEFLLVSREVRPVVNEFVKVNRYTFPVYRSDEIPEIFQSHGIPATFILSKNGKIARKEVGSRDWGGPETIELLTKLAQE